MAALQASRFSHAVVCCSVRLRCRYPASSSAGPGINSQQNAGRKKLKAGGSGLADA